MKTIYAFGCSMTHGAELVTVNASEENVLLSYPVRVAVKLKLSCENWAIPGNSAENIFHNFMDVISKVNSEEIAFVIYGWTSPVREVWVNDNRTWQFLPGWCCSTEDLTAPYTYIYDPKPRWSPSRPRVVSDGEEYLKDIDDFYTLLSKHKWNHSEYTKKQQHYVTAVRSYCANKNIKLIETCWWEDIPDVKINISKIVDSDLQGGAGHPTKEEHSLIADTIIKEYAL